MQQYYDGNALRGKKTDNGITTYYLRSSVLGGQVVAEITGGGAFQRGYVYLGGQLLAVQYQGAVSWIHQDPFVKSKRVTNSSGNVVNWSELDPWGGNTDRSHPDIFQPRRFTTYERDGNQSDEMFRRYNRWWSRFDQPDPYNGSYDLTNPQSFNRYSYVQNDPVNLVDPTGLFTNCGQGNLPPCDDDDPPGNPADNLPRRPIDDVPRRLPILSHPNRPRPGLLSPAKPEQSTREERCLNAIADAETISNRISKTIADSLIAPGGADEGTSRRLIN